MTRLSYPEVEGTLVKIQKNCSSLNSCEGDLVARKKKKNVIICEIFLSKLYFDPQSQTLVVAVAVQQGCHRACALET